MWSVYFQVPFSTRLFAFFWTSEITSNSIKHFSLNRVKQEQICRGNISLLGLSHNWYSAGFCDLPHSSRSSENTNKKTLSFVTMMSVGLERKKKTKSADLRWQGCGLLSDNMTPYHPSPRWKFLNTVFWMTGPLNWFLMLKITLKLPVKA